MDFDYKLSAEEVATLEWIVDEQNSVLREAYLRDGDAYNNAIAAFNQTVLVHQDDKDFVAPEKPVVPETPTYKTVESVMQEVTKDMLTRFSTDKRNQRLFKVTTQLQNAGPDEQEAILKKMGV